MRPLSVGEILDAAFAAFRRNFGRLCLAVSVIMIPSAIVQTLVFSSLNFDFSKSGFDSSGFSNSNTASGAQVAGLLVVYVLLIINQLLAPAACLRIIGADIMGNKTGAMESVGFAVRRLPRLLGVILLEIIAIIAGVFMCLVGAIWLYVLFAMAIPAALFESASPVAAMRRSRDLVSGYWWRTFGTLALMTVIVSIVQNLFAFTLVGGILIDNNNDVLAAVLFTLASVVGYAVSLPLQAATTAYIYFDLRVRKEGFDLQLMADRIESAPAGMGAGTEVEGLPPRDAPSSGGGFLPPQPPGA